MQIILSRGKKLSLVVTLFLVQVSFLMEISFINVDLPNKWGILYILFSSSEGDKKLLKLLDLHSLQFKIIHKPDWYVLGWHVLVTLPFPHFFFPSTTVQSLSNQFVSFKPGKIYSSNQVTNSLN